MINHPNRTTDSKVRRAAKSVGLRAHKARGQEHLNNLGGYQLVDDRNVVVGGSNFGFPTRACSPLSA